MWELILGWITATGTVAFFAMGIDKARAQDRAWRVPEKTFYSLGLIGGAFGVVLGMILFHHKTSKISFAGVAFILAAAWLGILVWAKSFLGSPFT
jgi:uncharacterized membrane protein YsdA (DUF1294 family)